MLIDPPFQAIQADAWDPDPADVASLNAAASDRILQCIDDVRRAGAQGQAPPRSTSVLLLGPAGSGKTHLFARLRTHAGSSAVFVHTRPAIGLIPSPEQLLVAIVDSLKRPVAQNPEHRQVDVIVGAMLATMEGEKAHFPLAFLDDCRRNEERRAIVEGAIERLENQFRGLSPRYLERLLSVPFVDRGQQRVLFTWLSGGEPSQADLERIDENGPLSAGEIMPALRTLGLVAAYGAPIALVFDQLENLAEEEGRTGKIIAHARLYSELRDTVRGLVLVQMALDAEWSARIHPVLHTSDRDRLEENVLHLAFPKPEERKALIECWRAALPEEQRARPFPYPLSQAELERWMRTPGVTPRMLMQACREAYLRGGIPLDGDAEDAPPSPDEALMSAWKHLLERARARIDEAAAEQQGVSAHALRAGLLSAFDLVGIKTSGSATDDIPSVAIRNDNLALDVLIAQHSHYRSLGAAVETAMDLAGRRSVILLRERACAIPPTWKKVRALLHDFTAFAGARFFEVDREDIARLLALEEMLSSARSQDLSDGDGQPIAYADVMHWAREQLGCQDWSVIATLLERSGTDTLPDRRKRPEPADRNEGPEPVDRRKRPELVDRNERLEPVPEPQGPAGPVRAVLERLRVASMDRLLRETRMLDPAASRASVKAELDRLPVKVLGSSIVALEDV